MVAPALTYHSIKFKEPLTQYKGLKTFRPIFPVESRDDWYYLGPVAVGADPTPEPLEQQGLIVRANDPSALDEIVDWEPVFIDIEGRAFSTWRGIPRKEDAYVVVGHFFVTGVEKPTPKQTARIRAIRRDLVDDREPNHLVWTQRLPKAILTIWNVLATDLLHIPTGAFASKGGSSVGLLIPVLRFNANIQQA